MVNRPKIYLIIVILILLQPFARANGFKQAKIHKLDWNGIEVTWLQDERFPTYNIIVYFADGALSDVSGRYGETNMMFSLIDSGTRRFNQKEISDNLEFFGASYGSMVFHEYSIYKISGLVKDIVPTVKKICHLFSEATFPKKELSKEKRRIKNSLQNLVNSHSSLASRAFRKLSLITTPYHWPVSGQIKNISKINKQVLRGKLEYFNKNVAKRIYISGPKQSLIINKVITQECGWSGEKSNFVRSVNTSNISKQPPTPKIFLVTVPVSTQAQVRIGRHLIKQEIDNSELIEFAAQFLGGGFTSKLMQEVRVKRGLTYSIGAFAAGQKDYGRTGISTFTKTESVIELLAVIKTSIESLKKGLFENDELERSRNHLVGSYPFRFERNSAYLQQLLFLDHIGKPYDELYQFQDRIKKIKRNEVVTSVGNLFNWEKQVIVILGSKKLLKSLKEIGDVKVVSYKEFL